MQNPVGMNVSKKGKTYSSSNNSLATRTRVAGIGKVKRHDVTEE